MPFAVRNLSVLSYAAGFTAWHYKGANTLHEVGACARAEVLGDPEGFFSPSWDLFQSGDKIDISCRDGFISGALQVDEKKVRLFVLAYVAY